MKIRARDAIAAVLVLAVACGGDGAVVGVDYPTALARISENALIQESGLAKDLRVRLRDALPGEERLDALVVYVGQSARLYQDVVDALNDLQPTDGLTAPHDAYVAAWQAQLDLILTIRDAGFGSAPDYLEALEESTRFDDARSETEARCEDLQSALAAAGHEVDLACDGAPA